MKLIFFPCCDDVQGKGTKYRLREEITKGLLSGKLYCFALDNLYRVPQRNSTQNNSCQGLTHWDIIKILSRRGIYVAQPSDMKLTEGTLRQKPIRIVSAFLCLLILECDKLLVSI